MAIIDEINAASYAGVSFLARDTEMSGGRKDVLHQFPNSDKQQIEDLGKRTRSYAITAIINETSSSSYFVKRNLLLQALEAGNPSDLIHPFYGTITNIVARTFTIRESLTSIGDSEIDIVFAVSDTLGQPVTALARTSATVLSKTKDTVSARLVQTIIDSFLVRGSDGGNFNDANNSLTNFVGIIRDSIVSSPVDTGSLDSFTRTLDVFEENIPTFIYNQTALGNGISSTISEFAGLYPAAIDKVNVMRDLFNFGQDDVAIVEDTFSRRQRRVNRDVINNSINTLSLSESYVASSQITFSNINEIIELEDILENQYRFIIR